MSAFLYGLLLLLLGLALMALGVFVLKTYPAPTVLVAPPAPPAPLDKETRIEHVITMRHGVREEHWYIYIYVEQPGWFLQSGFDSGKEAIQMKRITDELNSPHEEILRETLPTP